MAHFFPRIQVEPAFRCSPESNFFWGGTVKLFGGYIPLSTTSFGTPGFGNSVQYRCFRFIFAAYPDNFKYYNIAVSTQQWGGNKLSRFEINDTNWKLGPVSQLFVERWGKIFSNNIQ